MPCQLSAGAIEAMSTGKNVAKPILQILGSKKISSNSTDRYRIMVSDGIHCHAFAMLGTQLNPMVANKELDNFTVIRLEKFVCNKVQEDKNILVLLEVTVVETAQVAGGKIGNPVTYGGPTASGNQDKPSSNVNAAQAPPASNSTNQDDSAKPKPSFSSYQMSVKSPPKRTFPEHSESNSGYRSRNPPGGKNLAALGYKNLNTSFSPSTKLYPISSLTPYQNRWVIKARVMNKTNVRTWSNSRGEGKLFSFELIDESGALRVTGFNEECDKFFDMLEIDKVYYVSNGTLKEANKKFTSIKNDYEMTLRRDSLIELCDDDCDSVPELQFSFVPISDLPEVSKDTCIDVIGVCKSCTTVQTITARATQRELKKRELHLVDESNKEVTLTLWADDAENFNGENNPVVAARGARVSDFGGVSLSMVMQSTLFINPSIERAFVLQGWYEREGKEAPTESLSTRGAPGGASSDMKLLKEINQGDLGKGEKPDYIVCVATVVGVQYQNTCYKACPNDGCNKKLVESHSGMYRCEKCNLDTSDFKWRLLLTVDLGDFSDGISAVCFHEAAEVILGKKAEQIGELMLEPKRVERLLHRSIFKEFTFRIRVKMESFNDECRLRNTILSAIPVNLEEYNSKWLKELQG